MSRTLNLLFVFALLALLYTLPYFSPENVFFKTSTRLQTSNELIFTRLSAMRPLTDFDRELKPKLTANNVRLIYFAYGPDTVAHCTFCAASDPLSYLYYALPSLATPHLLHLLILGLVTSPLISGAEGSRWRTPAMFAGFALGAGDLYLHLSYDLNTNAASTNVKDIDFFFWRMRMLRGIAVALVDGLLGWVIWLASTNRFFLAPPSPAQRIDAASEALEAANFRSWATGNVRNTIVRDKELRDGMMRYWKEEKEVFEDREVVNATKSALERIDMQALAEAAEKTSTDILNTMPS